VFANARNLFDHPEICSLRVISLDAPTLGSGHPNHPCNIIHESAIL
jgi:hypothetical protein